MTLTALARWTRFALVPVCVIAIILLSPGCGQITWLRVVRLGDVEHDPASKVGALREAIHDRAAQLSTVIKPIAANRLAVDQMKARAEQQKLDDPTATDYDGYVAQAETLLKKLESIKDRTSVSEIGGANVAGIDQLANLAEQLDVYASQSAQMPDRAFELVVPIDPQTGTVDPKGRALIDKAKATAKVTIAKISNLASETKVEASKLQQRLNSSGFLEVGEFVINPADPDLNERQGADWGNPTVVFSEVIGKASGETGLLLVQQSPASFRMLSLAADPTEVLRNSLVAVNQVLQIVATLGPLAGIPIPKVPVPQVAAGAQQPEAPAPVPAQAFDVALESKLRALRVTASNAEYQSVATNVRGAELDPAKRADQAEQLLMYLQAALGRVDTPAPVAPEKAAVPEAPAQPAAPVAPATPEIPAPVQPS